MKRLLIFVLVLISVEGFSQGWRVFKVGNVEYYSPPSNYSFINGRYRYLALMTDSGFHLPSYNGVPTGTRVGVWPHDGAMAMDTTNGRVYGFRNSAWFGLANQSDVTSLITFPYTTLKYLTGYNTFGSLPDSVRSFITANLPVRFSAGGVTSIDTSVAFVPSVTTNARLKKIVDSLNATSSTPTLQQVFNTEIGGSVLTKIDTIVQDSDKRLFIYSPSNY